MKLCCSCFNSPCTCSTPFIQEIDDELYDVIVAFNRVFIALGWDIRTKFCCAGHVKDKYRLQTPYILFASKTRKYFPYICERFNDRNVDYVFRRFRPAKKSLPANMRYKWTFRLNMRNLNRCPEDGFCADEDWLYKQRELFVKKLLVCY